jgi:transposase
MTYDVKFREKAIKYKESGHTFPELKKVFGIIAKTYYDWKKRLAKTGSLKPKKVLTRKFRKIDPERLRQLVQEKPDAYPYPS